jgi:hypothetical protein
MIWNNCITNQKKDYQNKIKEINSSLLTTFSLIREYLMFG